MLRVIAIRALLVAAPFAVWFIWRAMARRSGRAMGSTPWVWLFVAGAVLAGGSLIVSVFLHPDTRHASYVPGEVTPSGAVTEGRFEKKAPQ